MPPTAAPAHATIIDREKTLQIAIAHLLSTYFDGGNHSIGTSPALQTLPFPSCNHIHDRAQFRKGDGNNAIHYAFTDAEWQDHGRSPAEARDRVFRISSTVTFYARVCRTSRDHRDKKPDHAARRIADRIELLFSTPAKAILHAIGIHGPELVTPSRAVSSTGQYATRRLAVRLHLDLTVRTTETDPLA